MPNSSSPGSSPPPVPPEEDEIVWEDDAPIRALSQEAPRRETARDAGPSLASRALTFALTFLTERFSGIWYWNSVPAISGDEKRIRILGILLHLTACWMYFRPWSLFAYLAGGLSVPVLLVALTLTLAFLLSGLRPLRYLPAAHLALAVSWLFLGLVLGFRIGKAFAYIDRAMPMALAGAASWICATRIADLRGGRTGAPGAESTAS